MIIRFELGSICVASKTIRMTFSARWLLTRISRPVAVASALALSAGLMSGIAAPLRAAEAPAAGATVDQRSALTPGTQRERITLGSGRRTCVLAPRAKCAGVSHRGKVEFHGNLSRADFTRASIQGADFSRANLDRARFAKAKLPRVDLSGASLKGANLTRANLVGADLTGADLSGALLANANLARATLDGVISRGIKGRPKSLPTGWSLVKGKLVGPPGGDSGGNQPDPNDPIVQDVEINVYTASDLSATVKSTVEETLAIAREEWGLRWALEYWMFGADRAAAIDLIEQSCAIRAEYRQWGYDECMGREASPTAEYNMLWYQQLSADAINQGLPMGSAALSGEAQARVHRFYSSIPLGLEGKLGTPGDEDLKTLFHEYWHAVQSEFIAPETSYEQRDRLMGPVWFVEGSAEYMAQYMRAQKRSAGQLPDVPAGDRPYVFTTEMEYKLDSIDASLAGECRGRELVTLLGYDDPCAGSLGYEMGAWAIAYLMSQAGDDVLLEKLHPRIEELGWQKAFEAAAGMSLQAFSDEFQTFLEGSTAQRLAILPEFAGA